MKQGPSPFVIALREAYQALVGFTGTPDRPGYRLARGRWLRLHEWIGTGALADTQDWTI